MRWFPGNGMRQTAEFTNAVTLSIVRLVRVIDWAVFHQTHSRRVHLTADVSLACL